MFRKISDFDNRVSVYWTNRHFSAKTTKFLKFYVRLGDGYIWALFIAFLIWRTSWQSFLPILWQALVSLAMSLLIYEGVKLSTKRPRPFAANPQIKAEVPPLDKYSFPSGHTMNNLAVASDHDAVAAHVGTFARVLWRALVLGYYLRILAWHLELCARTRFVDPDFCCNRGLTNND